MKRRDARGVRFGHVAVGLALDLTLRAGLADQPPEVVAGGTPTPAADVFSFGATAFMSANVIT